MESFYLRIPSTSKDLVKSILIGSSLGVGFIILNILAGLAIGVPEDFIYGGIFAPIFEEIAFLLLAILLYTILTKVFKISKSLSLTICTIVIPIAFSLTHFKAYGNSIQALTTNSGAFIGAGLFRGISLQINRFDKEILSQIIFHGIVNIWMLHQLGLLIL